MRWMRELFDQEMRRRFSEISLGSLGGPIQKDKTFAFGNYEGFRQHLHQTSVAFVPDAAARAAAAPSVSQTALESLARCSGWRPRCDGSVHAPLGLRDRNGVQQPVTNVAKFWAARVDHIFSSKETFGAIYTATTVTDFTGNAADPFKRGLEDRCAAGSA